MIFSKFKIPNSKFIFAAVFLISIFYFPNSFVARAQVLSLETAKTSYHVGDSFSVSVVLDTKGKSINTVSGTIDIPTDKLPIIDTRYGNSILSLWIEKPTIDYAKGVINFSGGVPGGFNGSRGPLFSFGLSAKRSGSAVLTPLDIKVLLNDGQGTELTGLTLPTLTLSIAPAPAVTPKAEQAPSPAEVYAPPPDQTPPEAFVPLVSRHPSVADNKYFVSFSAVDKDTGISHYEIVEMPFLLSWFSSRWNIGPVSVAGPPYILRGQRWAYIVVVRAYDQAGNMTEERVEKPFAPEALAILAACVIFVVILLTIFLMYRFSVAPLKKKLSRFTRIER